MHIRVSRLFLGPTGGNQRIDGLPDDLGDVGELTALLRSALVFEERAMDRPVDLLRRYQWVWSAEHLRAVLREHDLDYGGVNFLQRRLHPTDGGPNSAP